MVMIIIMCTSIYVGDAHQDLGSLEKPVYIYIRARGRACHSNVLYLILVYCH